MRFKSIDQSALFPEICRNLPGDRRQPDDSGKYGCHPERNDDFLFADALKNKVIVKRTLRQFGYPPDMQLLATETVLKQAEMIADALAA